MPSFDSKTLLLKDLNTLNGQAYTYADVSLSFTRQEGQTAHALLAALPTGVLTGAGSIDIQYRRLSLSVLQAISGVTTFSTRRITKISLLLAEISRQTGFVIVPTDVVDGSIDYDENNTATVRITANATTLTYSGSCEFTIIADQSDIDLASVIRVTDYMDIDVDSTDYVKSLIQANTSQHLDWSGITLGTPTSTPAGTTRNSQTTLTAIPGSGYTGSVTIYFDRFQSSAVNFPNLFMFPLGTDWTGTPWQWLTQFHPSVAYYYTEDQFNPEPFTIPAGKVNYTVPAGGATNSWKIVGGENIQVNPSRSNWLGTDGVSGFDAVNYKSTAFTDYAGLSLTPRASAFGYAGALPTVGAPDGPFAGGLAITGNCSFLTNSGGIPATVLAGSWTLDAWYYLERDIPAPDANPLIPLTCAGDVNSTTYTNRLVTYQAQASNTYAARWIIQNNQAEPNAARPSPDLMFSKKGWHHLAITYNASNGLWSYYCDGTLAFTLTRVISAGTWYSGCAAYFSNLSLTMGIERWRLRKDIKFTGAFKAQDLYPQNYSGTTTPLSSAVDNKILGMLPASTTDRQFLDMLTAPGKLRIFESDIVLGEPVPYTGPEGNTSVTLTANGTGRYSGSVTVYLTREGDVAPTIPDQWKFVDMTAFTGNALDYVKKYFPALATTYFSDWTASDAAALPTFTIAAGELPPLTLTLSRGKYHYAYAAKIRVNPKDVAWPGTNVITGWDTNIYVESGFTDHGGKQAKGLASVNGAAGTSPVLARDNFAFGQGLNLNVASVTTTDTIPGSTFTGAFTVDFWVKVIGGTPADNLRLPYGIFGAQPNNTTFYPTSRLQMGSHDASIGYWAIWNNDYGAVAYGNSKYTAMCLTGWHHVAFVYDGAGTGKLYMDGKLVNTFSRSLASPAANAQVGTWGYLLSNMFPRVERWRMRSGAVFTAPFTAADVYK